MNLKLSNDIKAEAQRLGFFACGIARAERVDEATQKHVRSWLGDKKYAGMEYMNNNTEKRLDPRLLMPGLKSIVSFAINYTPHSFIPEDEYQLAAYAYGLDYHDVVKAKLRQLASNLHFVPAEPEGEPILQTEQPRFRIFCDTAPVLERYWAAKAGLGWIGKNRQLIIPKAGSMFFLAELFLDVELEYDEPMESRCGRCRLCLDACPTKAIKENTEMDAALCISYQTIENRNDISTEVTSKLSNNIYGCDICLRVCPWNRKSTPTTIEEFYPKAELLTMTKENWSNLTIEQYQKLFKGSAVKRAKYLGLMRNIKTIEQYEQCRNEERTP